ncbi:hypothetical protein [Thermodesulforhabdus norvegica]|uniref:ATP-dependent sacrificial sulfur transferase LarE n=1 Tax=Thermodesulforhabdus norvegica TaxID=39841 RepID=A0A1I4UKZ3_9BACT|nr:hypothetical protein [Thermodesulforhabdus norvegica]SFM89657.1 uncharacterized protein SAMN05660836_01858 [Thermodesulforhabdus norvegica]
MSTVTMKLTGLLENERWAKVREILESRKKWLLAYSGGKDSTALLWFASCLTSSNVIPVFLEHELLPSSEKERASSVLKALDLRPGLIRVSCSVLKAPEVLQNAPDRCYHCKKILMNKLVELASSLGCDGLCDGTVADDEESRRPGVRALRERGVISPLAVAGIDSREILRLFRDIIKLPAELIRPESCLATRLPYGTQLDGSILSRLDGLENLLKSFCRGPVRARYHPSENLVRIELDPVDFVLLFDNSCRVSVINLARNLGFGFVTLDVSGFKSGSWDR